jgi:hypothetical protein
MTPFLTAAIAEMLPNAGRSTRCAECGFAWEVEGADALATLLAAPDRFSALLRDDVDAGAQASEDRWSPSGYVWHVGDLVRAWAERLHSLRVAPATPWAGFDPDELAHARHYEALPPTTAAWALARATDALERSLDGLDLDLTFEHPEWGQGTVADALRWLAHEAEHHDLDVRRGLSSR